MNISAYIAACDVWDLDRNAKAALMAVCGRVDYPSGAGEVPIGRVAADMKVHYRTAHLALQRAVDAGYLFSSGQLGRPAFWQLNLARLTRDLPRADLARLGAEVPRASGARTMAFRDVEGSGAASLTRRASGAAGGGKPARADPPHPPSCACGGTGWVDVHNNGTLTVAACPGGGDT